MSPAPKRRTRKPPLPDLRTLWGAKVSKDDQIRWLHGEVQRLEAANKQLRHDIDTEVQVTTPDSTEPPAVPFTGTDQDCIRIYIVWAIGAYPNGAPSLDIRAITTSLGKAKLYSKMLRRDRQPYELWQRIAIEPRVANHLYGQNLREAAVVMGLM